MAVKDAKSGAPKNASRLEEENEEFSPLSVAGIRTGAVQSKVVKGFIIVSGLIMAGGLIVSGLNPGGTNDPTTGGQPPKATAAVVGNQNIEYGRLNQAFSRMVDQNAQYGMKTGVTDFLQFRYNSLQQLTDNAANIVAAENAGIVVTDQDIDKKIDEYVKEQLKAPPGTTEAAFRRQMEAQFGSVEKAEEEVRKNIDRDAVKKQLFVEKLEKKIKDDNKITENDYKRSVTKLKLWQIVIQPKQPNASAKDFQQQMEKNKVEAKTRAEKVFAELKAKPTLANFKEIAKKSSDDAATKSKGGDFGWKLPSELYYAPGMGDTVSKTASSLVPPIFADSGPAYIFFIESRKTELPKGFDKNKKKLVEDYEKQKDDEAWGNKQQEYKKAVTPEIHDPALAAYEIQSQELIKAAEGDKAALREDAIGRYQEAIASSAGMEKAAVGYQLAELYRDSGDKAKRVEALAEAVKAGSNDAKLRIEYARALREAGKTKESVDELKAASKLVDENPSGPSMFGSNPDDQLRNELATEFTIAKQPKLAEAERKKIKPQQPGAMGGMGGFGGMPGVQVMPGGGQ